VVKITLSIIMI